MHIRGVQQEDLNALAELWLERRVLQGQADARLAPRREERAAWLAQAETELDNPSSVMLVAEDHDSGDGVAPVGFAAARMLDKQRGEIISLVLDAHTYHPGLGRDLVETLRAWLAQQGAVSIVTQVPRFHAVEQAFWRSLGAHDADDPSLEQSPAYLWMSL